MVTCHLFVWGTAEAILIFKVMMPLIYIFASEPLMINQFQRFQKLY